MIDLEQLVEMSWNIKSKNWYIARGYKFTKMRDKFLVKAKDLTKRSKAKVEITCDVCGKANTIMYYGYLTNSSNGRYRCCKCASKEKMQDKKVPWNTVKKLFADKGYILLSKAEEYENNKTYLKYICSKHREVGVQTTSYNLLTVSENNCRTCFSEARQGEKAFCWRGGVTSLNKYIREKLIVWKSDSMKSCDYKCVLTGDRFDNVHHLQGFNLILKQVVEEIGLEIKENVGDYTEDDLEILVNNVIARHYKYPLGVCLRRDVHMLFHSLYGMGDNTPDQFYEFRDRYNNGEFNEILSCN